MAVSWRTVPATPCPASSSAPPCPGGHAAGPPLQPGQLAVIPLALARRPRTWLVNDEDRPLARTVCFRIDSRLLATAWLAHSPSSGGPRPTHASWPVPPACSWPPGMFSPHHPSLPPHTLCRRLHTPSNFVLPPCLRSQLHERPPTLMSDGSMALAPVSHLD